MTLQNKPIRKLKRTNWKNQHQWQQRPIYLIECRVSWTQDQPIEKYVINPTKTQIKMELTSHVRFPSHVFEQSPCLSPSSPSGARSLCVSSSQTVSLIGHGEAYSRLVTTLGGHEKSWESSEPSISRHALPSQPSPSISVAQAHYPFLQGL